MTAKVNPQPLLPRPGHQPTLQGLYGFDNDLSAHLFRELLSHALRLNSSLTLDGEDRMEAPLPLLSSTVAGVPTASLWEGSVIYISNETGGKTVAFSDGTNWRRVQDRAVIA